jgi:hypothetical protein
MWLRRPVPGSPDTVQEPEDLDEGLLELRIGGVVPPLRSERAIRQLLGDLPVPHGDHIEAAQRGLAPVRALPAQDITAARPVL